MTINITPEISQAYREYLDQEIDADLTGAPIRRRDTYPFAGNENCGLVDFAAGFQEASRPPAYLSPRACLQFATHVSASSRSVLGLPPQEFVSSPMPADEEERLLEHAVRAAIRQFGPERFARALAQHADGATPTGTGGIKGIAK